jgi:hypothetical protein
MWWHVKIPAERTADATVNCSNMQTDRVARIPYLCHHISDLEGGLALAVLAQPQPLAEEGGCPSVDVLAIEEAKLLIAEAGRRDAHHLHLPTHNTEHTFSSQVYACYLKIHIMQLTCDMGSV